MPPDIALMIAEVRRIQAMPYTWPAPPDADSCRKANAGSCASKHALLAEELEAIGLQSLPLFVVGRLVPLNLRTDPAFAEGANLYEVHECLTVMTPWSGPLRVDVTWDPPLIERGGLPGTLDWDGRSDMLIAVGEGGPCWSIPREGLRQAKEALRSRIYGPGQRELRDRILVDLVLYFKQIRAETGQI
jgi:hypothetical protein